MSYNKKYPTGFEKRTLSYSNPVVKQTPLELPERYYSKISNAQFKKIKDAFFVMSSPNYTLNYQNFTKAIRSLGIIVKTATIYELLPKKQKSVTWEMFIQAYIGLRNNKGSYKEVDTAVNILDKQYHGRWEILFKDLKELGDVLNERQLDIFKKQILGDQLINSQNLKNALLGYK